MNIGILGVLLLNHQNISICRNSVKKMQPYNINVMQKHNSMDFLPTLKDEKKVYAGLWKRLCAAITDMLVWIPVLFIFYHIQSINIVTAVIATVIQGFSFSIYSIFLNLKYGGTLGKLAVGIRITKPNGEKIGLREALLRSSVDIIYGLLFVAFQVYAISQVDSDVYLAAGYMERMKLLGPYYPEYNKYSSIFFNVWYWGEMIVLLFNKRKRALHDFIAGTVVIHKKFA